MEEFVFAEETLEKLQDITAELHRLEKLEMFTVGFRLGSKLMLEAQEDDPNSK